MEERYCPNCGRYVGSLEVCPYCGTKIPKHTSYYYAKYGALTFAVFGVIFLLIIAQNTPVQYVHIGDITPTYNYAYVKIRGVVNSPPSYVMKSDGSSTLYINVDDGTGEISVHVYNPIIEKIVRSGKLPGYGDFVEITGEIYFRGTNKYMIVNHPDQISIRKAEPVNMTIEDIKNVEYPNANYIRVMVTGEFVSYRTTTSGSYVLNFTDGTGYIDVYIPSYIPKLYGFDVQDYMEKEISLTGSLEWYGSEMTGGWEIIPSNLEDIKVIG